MNPNAPEPNPPPADLGDLTLGERMMLARKRAGIGTIEMAEHIGRARNTVTMWETDRSRVSRATLFMWSHLCGVPIDWLTGMQFSRDRRRALWAENPDIFREHKVPEDLENWSVLGPDLKWIDGPTEDEYLNFVHAQDFMAAILTGKITAILDKAGNETGKYQRISTEADVPDTKILNRRYPFDNTRLAWSGLRQTECHNRTHIRPTCARVNGGPR